MRKYGMVEFTKEVDKAYDILWKMYKPENGCPWGSKQESLLKKMLNSIDDVLGR